MSNGADGVTAADLADRLRRGEVVIMPCDTIYGFVGLVPGADPVIRSLKGRGETKPFLQLADGPALVARYTAGPVPEDLAALWPGPVTAVLENASGGTTAWRVPEDPILRELVTMAGGPLYSTSVNRSGRPPLWRIADIRDEFGRDVPCIVDGGDLPGRLPSTVVDVTVRPWKILRQGAGTIPAELLE